MEPLSTIATQADWYRQAFEKQPENRKEITKKIWDLVRANLKLKLDPVTYYALGRLSLSLIDIERKHLAQAVREWLVNQYVSFPLTHLPNEAKSRIFEYLPGLSYAYLVKLGLSDRDKILWINATENHLSVITAETDRQRILKKHGTDLKYLDASNIKGWPVVDGFQFTTNLTTLKIPNCRIGDNELETLLQHISPQQLTSLDLSTNRISDEKVSQLIKFDKLISLDLTWTLITQIGVHSLISHLENLTFLGIGGYTGIDVTILPLAEAKNLRGIALLYIKINELSVAALSQISKLTYLELDSDYLTPEGFEAVTNLSKLKALKLTAPMNGPNHPLRAHALKSLVNLTFLDLGKNWIGDTGAAKISMMTSLETLNLRNNKIGKDGVWFLRNLTRITSLDLSENRITDNGICYLQELPLLRTLSVNSCGLGPDDLVNFSFLRNLSYLNIKGNKIGDDGVWLTNELFISMRGTVCRIINK